MNSAAGGAPDRSATYSYSGVAYANPDAPTQIANGVSTTTFTYDNNGNVTQKTVDGTTTTYQYNYANQLIALGVGGATTTYGYDYAGSRVIQTGTSTTWIYPFKWVSIASSTGSGAKYSTTTDYVFSPKGDTLVSTIDQQLASGVATGSPATHYVHPDHLGSTNIVTNASGTVDQTLDYFPYGATRISSGQNTEARQFIGQFTDQSALSYLNARYYDGSRGQFLSQDPMFLGDPKQQDLQNPQNLNAYDYSSDNPIANKDPSGKAVYLVASPIGWTGGYYTHLSYYVSPEPGSRYANVGTFTLSGEPGGRGPGLFGSLQTNFGVNGSTGDSARGLPSDSRLYTQLSPSKGQTEDNMIGELYGGFVAVGNANVAYWPWGNQSGQNNGNSNNTAYTEAQFANILPQFNSFSSGFHAPGSQQGVPISSIVAGHNAALGGGGVSSNGTPQPNSNSWWTTPSGAIVNWGGTLVAPPPTTQK